MMETMRAREFFRRARTDVGGPVHGIRVLDVTKVWSGPMTSAILGDLGADVIRVELPGRPDGPALPRIPGTRLSWFRETVHRNKRSIGLDLRVDADRFLQLVATADVVVENYLPGTLDRWGVGYEACRAVRLDVVVVSISGYGQYGPDRERRAYDPAVQAASGLMALSGEPDGPPMRAPTFLADDVAALHGAIGALAALAHRSRTGEGQHVDVAMSDCLFSVASGLPTLAATGAPPQRFGNEHDFVVPSNVYACTDGHLFLAVALDRHWRALAEAIDRPELGAAAGFATAAERLTNRVAVNAVVAQWCAGQTLNGALSRFVGHGLVVAPVRTLSEAVADPGVVARGVLAPTPLSDGTVVPLVAPPVKFSRTPTRIRHAAPVPGADTDEVLAELDRFAAPREKNDL